MLDNKRTFEVVNFNLLPPQNRPAALRSFIIQYADARFELDEGEAFLNAKEGTLTVEMERERVVFDLGEQAKIDGLLSLLSSCPRATLLPENSLDTSRHYSLRVAT